MAQDILAQESLKDSSQSISGSQHSCSHPIWHLRVSDENICQVVHNLDDFSQHDGEAQEVFQACKVMSTHIHRNSKKVETIPCTEITQKDDLIDDLSHLYAEQVKYNTKKAQHL